MTDMEKTEAKMETTQKKAKKNLLSAIEQVVKAAEDSEMEMRHFEDVKEDVKFLAETYGITATQVVIFCVCMEKGPYRVDFDDISTFLDISNIRAMMYSEDIAALVRRRLLRYHDVKDEDSFDVPAEVIKSLRENTVYEQPSHENLDCFDLMEVVRQGFDDLSNDLTTPETLAGEIDELLKLNSHLYFSRQMLAMPLCSIDRLLLMNFCHLLINNEDNNICFSDIEDIYESKGHFNRVKHALSSGNHSLMRLKLIEHRCNDGMADISHFKLTDETKRTLLKEFNLIVTEEKISDLVYPDTIKEKDLYYPEKVSRQVRELSSFLVQEQYLAIRERMKERGFHSGFACLFYGGPGTGKTETALQLARQTGRCILMVDVPEIKSKWVGESEKNIKALFERYRQLVQHCELAPILLFNEADGIIGIRKTAAENAVDKMENTVQNIILQEMENLDGILIATTNLVDNLDTAFERRFLYKIQFEKPDAAARRAIWQKMIPTLTDSELSVLSAAFDFSGGQIENVARKFSINEILFGEKPETRLATLRSYCEAERVNNKLSRRKIGY